MILGTECTSGLVIDTNVMAHADHHGSPSNASALLLLSELRHHEGISLILDDQGKKAPDMATSVLASEYRATLSPQGFALTLFATLMASGRVSFSTRPDHMTRKAITRLIPRNKRDCAVLGAAAGCDDRMLVSNDYDDFSEDIRRECRRLLNVSIMDSDEAAA